jgi:predicted small lipoprotein YifL
MISLVEEQDDSGNSAASCHSLAGCGKSPPEDFPSRDANKYMKYLEENQQKHAARSKLL